MKVLVTGSSGLLGREVSRQLQKKGVKVVAFDRTNGDDITDSKTLNEKIKGCDAVVHLAAVLDENQPVNTMRKINVAGTKNVLEASAAHRIARFVFASSVGVYGDQEGIKTEETTLQPETAYEQSKADAEKHVLSYQELVPFTIARLALVTGPNAYWKQIVSLVQKNFPLIGSGTNTWQTLYYKDAANALVFLLFLDEAENETFIVAGEDRPTLHEFIQTLRSQLGLTGPLHTIPVWLGKLMGKILGIWFRLIEKRNILSAASIARLQHERSYDLTKIHAYGWKARFGYREALKETVEMIQ